MENGVVRNPAYARGDKAMGLIKWSRSFGLVVTHRQTKLSMVRVVLGFFAFLGGCLGAFCSLVRFDFFFFSACFGGLQGAWEFVVDLTPSLACISACLIRG